MSRSKKAWKILWRFLMVLAILNFILIATGHDYFYSMLANTVFKGRLGPAIDEYEDFYNRDVMAENPLEWPISQSNFTESLSPSSLKKVEEFGTVAFLVAHRDSLVFEGYWEGYHAYKPSNSFSMAKSIVSALVGIAIEEGKLKNLDQPVADFFPQFNAEAGGTITLRHLLSMCSGINFEESYLNPFAFPAKANYGDDLPYLMTQYEAVSAPGEVFKYQSGNTQLLGLLLRKATGKPIAWLASEKIWTPMGAADTAYWTLDDKWSEEKAFCCFQSNARDFARFGQLYLNGGRSARGEQLIPEEYIKASILPAPIKTSSGEENAHYGLSWWLGEHKDESFFYARGIRGQYIIVIPERELVIVRLGDGWKRSKTSWHPEDVGQYIEIGLELASF